MFNIFGAARVLPNDAVVEVASSADTVIDIPSDDSLYLDVERHISCVRQLLYPLYFFRSKMGDLLSIISNLFGHGGVFNWMIDHAVLYSIYSDEDLEKKQYYIEYAPSRFLVEKEKKAIGLVSYAMHHDLSFDDLRPSTANKLVFAVIGVCILGGVGFISYNAIKGIVEEEVDKKNIEKCKDNEFCVKAIKEGVSIEDAKKFSNQYQILALKGKKISTEGALEIDTPEELQGLERGSLVEGNFDRSEFLGEESFQEDEEFYWF